MAPSSARITNGEPPLAQARAQSLLPGFCRFLINAQAESRTKPLTVTPGSWAQAPPGTTVIRIAAKIQFIAGFRKSIVAPLEALIWSVRESRMTRRPGGGVTGWERF